MVKQRIKLTESQLHNIIRKCVNEAVNEISPELAHKAANAAMERSVQNGDKRQMQSQKFANYAAQGAVRRNGMMNGNGMDNNTMSVNPTYNQHYKTYTYGSNTGTGDSQTMANTRTDLQNLGQSDYGNQKKQQERNAYQQKIANLKRMYGQDWQEHLYDER